MKNMQLIILTVKNSNNEILIIDIKLIGSCKNQCTLHNIYEWDWWWMAGTIPIEPACGHDLQVLLSIIGLVDMTFPAKLSGFD